MTFSNLIVPMSCSTNLTTFFWKSLTSMPLLNAWLIKNRKYQNGLQTLLNISASKKNKAHRSLKQNPNNNEAAKNSNCYATSLEKVLKS